MKKPPKVKSVTYSGKPPLAATEFKDANVFVSVGLPNGKRKVCLFKDDTNVEFSIETPCPQPPISKPDTPA